MKRFWGAVAALFLLSLLNLFPAPAHAANCPGFSYTLANGQVADATQVMSNFNVLLNCANNSLAHNGANADITSLSGLSTPLSASQGGTGQATSIFSSANSWTGVQTYNQANAHTGNETFSGASTNLAATLTNAAEPVTVTASAVPTTVNFYATSQSVLYYTVNATANWTVNLSGSAGTTLNAMLATGQAVTFTLVSTQGATPFYNTTVQVDGTTTGVTTKWQGVAPAAGNASGLDIYTYTVIKTGSATYTVLASQASFS